MRIVLRVVLTEFSLAWALMLAGSARAAARAWPFFVQTVSAGWRRRWRVRTCLLFGIPAAGCWPLLFAFAPVQDGYGSWLRAIAIPWWILMAVSGLRLLLAKAWHL